MGKNSKAKRKEEREHNSIEDNKKVKSKNEKRKDKG